MQRIGVLNGNNITYDHDLAGLVRGLTDSGVIQGGEISENKVQPVQAVIACQRSNGQKLMLYFESDEQVAIPSSGTFKVYIEVNQAKIDDGSENAENGTGIAEIKTGPTLPSQNFLLLASVEENVVKDERNLIPKIQSVAQRTDSLEEKMESAEGKIEQIEQKSGNDSIVISGEFGERIYNRNISEVAELESGTKNTSYFQFAGGSIMGFEFQAPIFEGFFKEAYLSFSWNYGDGIPLSKINLYNKEKTTLLHTFNVGTLTSATKIPLPKIESGEKYFMELHSLGGSNYIRLNRVNQNTFKLYSNGTLQNFSLYTKIEVVSHPYDNELKIIPVCLSYLDDGERELGKFYIANTEHDKVIGFCATSSSGGFTNKMIDSRTCDIEVYGQNMAGIQFQTIGPTSKFKLHGKRLGSGGEFRLRVFGLDSFGGIDKQNIIFTKNFSLDLFGLEFGVVELDAEISTQEGTKYAFVFDFPEGNSSKKLILSGLKNGITFTKNETINIGASTSTTAPIRIPINSSVDFLAKISFNARGNNSGLYCNANVYQGGELIASVRQGMPYAQEVEITINNIPVKGNRGDCFLVVYWNENYPKISNIKMTAIDGPTIFYQSDSGDAGLGTVGAGALYFSAICKKNAPKEKVVNKGLLDIEGINLMLGSVFYGAEGVDQTAGTLIGTKIQENKMLVEENVKFGNKSIFNKSSNLLPNQSLGFVVQQKGQYKYVARVNTSSGFGILFINGVKVADVHSPSPKEGIVDLRRGDTIFIISGENTNTVNVLLDISDENF